MSTDNITLDIETIPTQNRVHIDAITSKVQAELNDKVGRLTEEHDNVQPPGNVKDPEKIAEAIAKKRAGILQEIEATKAEAAAKLEDEYRKTSLNGGLGRVVVCSLAFGDGDPFALCEIKWKAPGAEKKVPHTAAMKAAEAAVLHEVSGAPAAPEDPPPPAAEGGA